MKRDPEVINQANAVSALPVNEGERSEPERTGRALTAPDPEVTEKPVRKKWRPRVMNCNTKFSRLVSQCR